MSTDSDDSHAPPAVRSDPNADAMAELRRLLARSGTEPGSALRERAAVRAAASGFLEPRASRDYAAEVTAVEARCRADGEENLIPAAAASLHEAWGDHLLATDPAAAAHRYELALRGYEQYASWATSGGEGAARMLDVRRLRAKLGGPASVERRPP